MGLIRNIANKFKFKSVTPIEFSEKLSVGEYETGRLALLNKGKIVADDLVWVGGESLRFTGCNSEMFLAETIEGDYRVYDKHGNEIVDSLKNPGDDFVEVSQEDNIYVINMFDAAKIVAVPGEKLLSEALSFVDSVDKNGKRLVTKFDLDGRFQPSYYVDKDFVKVSPEFVEEQDFGDFKILSVVKTTTQTKDYICDPDYSNPIHTYDTIDYVNGKFVASVDNGHTYLIDRKGDIKTKPLTDYKVLNNGLVVVLEQGKEKHKLLDNDFDVIGLIDNPVVDEFAGIVAGEMAGRYVMFGYDHKKLYEVNKNVAELMVEKLQGKRMSSQTLSYVLDNQVDMTKTMKAYELIVAENFKLDPENESLRELSLNARDKFAQAVANVTADRVRRANEKLAEMEEQKRRMEDKASKLQQRKGSASKYNDKIEKLDK